MNTYPLNYTDNTSSWNRFKLLFKLYGPVLKPYYFVFALYPFLAYILIGAVLFIGNGKYDGLTYIFRYLVMNVASTAFLCCSPIMLTKRNYQDVCSQLPVKASEKLRFLIINFVIIFPVLYFASIYLGQLVGKNYFNRFIEIGFFGMPSWEYMSTIQDLIPRWSWAVWNLVLLSSFTSIILYYMVKSKKNKALTAIETYVVWDFILAFLLIIWMVIDAVITSKMFMFSHITYLECGLPATLGTMVIVAGVYLRKLYKYLRNNGF